MSNEQHNPGSPAHHRLFGNVLSQLGIILAVCSLLFVIALLTIDFVRGFSNPYLKVLTYVVVPGILIAGLLLVLIGFLRERSHRRKETPEQIHRFPRIDLNVPRQRWIFLAAVIATFVFVLLSGVGTYSAYHFTESVQFCGRLCHIVMKPEYTLYRISPHARVACTACHVGPGADWFVKTKISGIYQIYATMADTFPRPIPTPIKNLRPARETCEQCHWPQKFSGSLERVHTHFRPDEKNSPWTIRMLLRIGGGDPAEGPVHGIHWHMNPSSRVEYIATDKTRQTIPWVKVTDEQGRVTIYQPQEQTARLKNVTGQQIRLMDCIDCHNRPTHIYRTPVKDVDNAIARGRIDRGLPFVKKHAVHALLQDAGTEAEGLLLIEKKLNADYAGYGDRSKIGNLIAAVQQIYRQSIFPEMKANWRVYPDNVGHFIFPGCVRCHDGEHVSDTGRTISHDCNTCHLIIAQGSETAPGSISDGGLEFVHPGDDIGKEVACSSCHQGALVE